MVETTTIVSGAVAALPAIFCWVLYKVHGYRQQFPDIPQLPRNFWLGNAKQLDSHKRDKREHPDHAFERYWKELKCPDMFIIDMKPIINLVVITDPFIAEQITQSSEQYSHGGPGKSWTAKDVEPIIGEQSMLLEEGEKWRATRKRYAPGFQPQHIKDYMLPATVKESKIFLNNLEAEYKKGEPSELMKLCHGFTLDVIGIMVLNKSFHAQTSPDGEGLKGPDGLLNVLERLQGISADRWTKWQEWFNFQEYYRVWKAKRTLENYFKDLIMDALNTAKDASSRSILALSIKNQDLTPAALKHSSDQLRTFLFAGYDTTASAIAWTTYFLGKPENADRLKRVLAEIDDALGSDDEEAERRLENDTSLPLLTNALKESLRVEPPAAASRSISNSEKDFYLTTREGNRHKVNDTVLLVPHRIFQTNPKIWGPDSYEWKPERWEDKEYIASLPVGAWRPFEHGPRDCIGQTLAMHEMKILLALSLRKWHFEKVTRQEDMGPLGEVWGTYKLLTAPSDNMRGRIVPRKY